MSRMRRIRKYLGGGRGRKEMSCDKTIVSDCTSSPQITASQDLETVPALLPVVFVQSGSKVMDPTTDAIQCDQWLCAVHYSATEGVLAKSAYRWHRQLLCLSWAARLLTPMYTKKNYSSPTVGLHTLL